jgi:hypothetical protein
LQFIRVLITTISGCHEFKAQEKNIKYLYRLILNQTITRPKLRKIAVDVASQVLAVCNSPILFVLTDTQIPSLGPLLSDETNSFFTKILSGAKPDNFQTVMYCLALLQKVITLLPLKFQLGLSVCCLNLTSFGQSLLTVWLDSDNLIFVTL